jgi:hypothetical protein
VYKCGSTEEFKPKIISMTTGGLRNLAKEGHIIAEGRVIEIVGKSLSAAYMEASRLRIANKTNSL